MVHFRQESILEAFLQDNVFVLQEMMACMHRGKDNHPSKCPNSMTGREARGRAYPANFNEDASSPMADNLFDRFAHDYEKIHNRSLPPGVRSDEFVAQKAAQVVQWLGNCYDNKELNYLDFGCGNGRLFKCLVEAESLKPLIGQGQLRLFGFDPSVDSLKEAQLIAVDERICFVNDFGTIPTDIHFDLVISCNVFHHIVPAEREETVRTLRALMKPKGKLVIWEHNPFNPLTRLIVKLCPFDQEASLLTLNTTRTFFEKNAFQYVNHAYVNVFPPKLQQWHAVSAVEVKLSRLPIGAQYWVMFECGERPSADASKRI
jgi:SAM-dependent methyltransferase